MDGMQRKDDTPQHKAVREALTNAIIHADFMANGTLKVEKLDDAFVFTNPGVLKLPVEQIYAGVEMAHRGINKPGSSVRNPASKLRLAADFIPIPAPVRLADRHRPDCCPLL